MFVPICISLPLLDSSHNRVSHSGKEVRLRAWYLGVFLALDLDIKVQQERPDKFDQLQMKRHVSFGRVKCPPTHNARRVEGLSE